MIACAALAAGAPSGRHLDIRDREDTKPVACVCAALTHACARRWGSVWPRTASDLVGSDQSRSSSSSASWLPIRRGRSRSLICVGRAATRSGTQTRFLAAV
eukprot:1718906-Pleurochrysis_carterae.AAC.1